jgi:SAM-dependent methyltransferase
MPSARPSDAPKIFTFEYYERMRELERVSWWNAGMRGIAERLLAQARLPASGLMLDVGCGSGQTIAWFARRYPSWRTAGLDVAADGVAAARVLGAPLVLRASALALPLRSETVDLVVTLDVLQHLPLGGGDRRALGEIARVLKPGGCLFVRTNAQSFPVEADDEVDQFHKYEPDELRERLRQSGFDVLRLGRVNAVLGLAEIPREIRARRGGRSYHGLLSEPRPEPRWRAGPKQAWLRLEGLVVEQGGSWPLGRTTLALCRRRAS